MSKIVIHQAFYGEVNRAHSKIHQTVDDSELTSFLIRFTDRPGSLAPGVVLQPYLSGSAFKEYYVFSKTFPDSQASRSGMVITHVLITEIASLEKLNDLKSILSLLISEVPLERTNLEPIELNVEHSNNTYEKKQPIYIQKSLSSFIKGDLPILFTGDLDSFEEILQRLWNSPIDKFREQIKYRASFSPKDIEGSDDLTLVFVQKELLPKWNSNKLISAEENDIIEITSPTEALFLGRQKENPLYDFLKTIGANLQDWKTYTQGELLYSDFVDLDNLNDPDLLRRDLRFLTKLSPDKNLGSTIKEKFLEKYFEIINNGFESNIKALRNISWDSFIKGEENGKNLVDSIIGQTIQNPQFKHIDMLSEVSMIAVNETNKIWWHKSVIDSFKKIISKKEDIIQKSIWKLLLFSKDCTKSTFLIIPSNKESELLLIQYLPKEVPPEIGNSFLLELQKRKWYLLHAVILLKLYKPKVAIEKQLTFEQSLGFDESIGLKLILKGLSDDEILSITLEFCNKKLIQELTKRVIENESLFNSIDLQVSCWLNIWTALLYTNQAFHYGIKGKEKIIVSSVFDMAIQGEEIDDLVFEKIANTTYSDISDFKNRQKVWSYIPATYQAKFIEATADSIVEKLMKEEIDGSSIEEKLSDHITSQSYMTSLLRKYRNEIEHVLSIFESFPYLPDRLLSDYIYSYKSQITEYQSQRLGSLILSSNYTTSARNVYDKTKYYQSFILAYNICKGLVKLNWFESILTPKLTPLPPKDYSMDQIKKISQSPLESLPTVVILTAIKEEYSAIREFLYEKVDATQNSTAYEAGIFELFGKNIAKVIIRECGPRNTNAAQETERAIQYFKPSAIFFVGIAGSRKPNDFSIGDVIYPEKIYSYEGGKSEENTFSSRPDMGGTSFHLSELAKKERRNDDWKQIIKNKDAGSVKADLGIIASGEKLVEHYDSDVGKILTKHFNDTSAVEMEGFGFAKAANRQGNEMSHMMIGVVRGISDIIEQPNNKKKGKENDRRPNNAKQLASDTAAAFTYWLIFKAFP